jgi:protein-disulfide isomerase
VKINRVLAGTIIAALGVWGSTSPATAQEAPKPAAAAPSTSGPQYREFVIGDAKAPVTIIEYASLTCSHCANFHKTAYQEIKKNYVDTGKVRFVFRDYPLDGLGTAGAVLARCAPGDRGMKLIDMMFKNQDTWVRAEKPIEPLKGYAQLAGMSSADVDACLKNEAIIKAVREVQNTGTTLYKIESTPTFFVDDEKVDGDRGYEFMAKLIDKKLQAKKK